ncbi:caspase family protein [Schlesneria paludicola]|uniref:caspase family protein n=1 Tax=Schlesneria paludicola TaxID=360056 RepID=UPI00029AB039|nr:caspase family protein [Schlesneria paludicola]
MAYRRHVIALIVCFGLQGMPCIAYAQGADEELGYLPVGASANLNTGYTNSWALIVGVNYEKTNVPNAARNLVPTLKNAENDANALKKALVELYGYRNDHIVLLTGASATKEAIEKSLNEFKDSQRITKDDSLLVFFSGHGARLENEANERGAIYGANVEFTEGGKLKGGYLRMHLDLMKTLDESITAKHKLLILDCCHSGEIFSLHARARSDADDRRALALFERANSIQAIASCRDRQRASDGSGEHSPFTAAFLQAMRRIPARESVGSVSSLRIGVNQLFTFMLPELKNLPNGQSPDCRLLGDVDGEFSFFPSNTKEAREEFDKFRTTDSEFRALQAMVPGDHGNWWFEEMPWFIPSLRLMILDNAAMPRSGLQSSAISKEELRTLAAELRRALKKDLEDSTAGVKQDLLRLRLKHFTGLLSVSANDSTQVVSSIVKDFESLAPDVKDHLSASDLHLLAVSKHYLHRKTDETEDVEAVEFAYTNALSRFDVNKPNELTLKSLCYADYGQFLSVLKRDYEKSALQFRSAMTLFSSDLARELTSSSSRELAPTDPNSVTSIGAEAKSPRIVAGNAPAAFRVFVLCSEALAWQNQNHWGKANELLSEALHVARDFDVDHELTVFVQNQIAWSLMVQWRVDEARQFFVSANSILLNLAKSNFDAIPQVDRSRQKEFETLLDYDYNALARYLHHLHGLAMAKRFCGHHVEAISDYREIVRMITLALEHLKHVNANQQKRINPSQRIASDLESLFLNRLVNSQERLADCSLFGDPDCPDLQESADDYRRALNACSFLPRGDLRENMRVGLLYKLSLTLSIPSSNQDLELARAYCQEAMALRKTLNIRSTEPVGTLGLITEAIVEMFSASNATESKTESLSKLRRLIHTLCDELRGKHHRDQSETLLLAAKLLVDQVPAEDRYHLAEDSEFLLYLCRLILPRGASAPNSGHLRKEIGTYLRPYYDTVMRNKLRMKSRHVKDLLEIQWEATRSEFYAKPTTPQPVLALYLMDKNCFLLLDIPGGASKHCCLEGSYYVSALTRASEGRADPLPLPEEIQQEVVKLAKRANVMSQPRPQNNGTDGDEKPVSQETALQLRWVDAMRGLPHLLNVAESTVPADSSSRSGLVQTTYTVTSESSGEPNVVNDGNEGKETVDAQTAKKVIFSRFPFILPNEIAVELRPN